jgi:hypothetical protein
MATQLITLSSLYIDPNALQMYRAKRFRVVRAGRAWLKSSLSGTYPVRQKQTCSHKNNSYHAQQFVFYFNFNLLLSKDI